MANQEGGGSLRDHLSKILDSNLPAIAALLWERNLWIVSCPAEYRSDEWTSRWMGYYAQRDAGQTEAYFREKYESLKARKLEDPDYVPDVPRWRIDPALLRADRAQLESGVVRFLEECRPTDVSISSRDLFDDYREWCESQAVVPYGSVTFLRQMRKLAPDREIRIDRRSHGWYLKTPRQEREERDGTVAR